MNKKKLVLCGLVLALTLCAAGCGKKTDDNQPKPETSTEASVDVSVSKESETASADAQKEGETEADKVTISDIDQKGIYTLTDDDTMDVTYLTECYDILRDASEEDESLMAYFEILWNLNQKEYCELTGMDLAYIDEDDSLDLVASCSYYGSCLVLYTIKDGKVAPIYTGDDWMCTPNLLGDDMTNGLDLGADDQLRTYAYLPKAHKFLLQYEEYDYDNETEQVSFYYFDGEKWEQVSEDIVDAEDWETFE